MSARTCLEIGICIEQLRGVRARLRQLGAKRAAESVNRAIKSAEGARRNADLKASVASMSHVVQVQP